VSDKPLIAITAGDPAGIGPEVVLAALADEDVNAKCVPYAVGNADLFRKVGAATGLNADLESATVEPDRLAHLPAAPAILDPTSINAEDVIAGEISAAAGKAAYESLLWATDMTIQGTFQALVTAPFNKKSLNLAGVTEPGHTEILAKRCNADDVAMLYWSPDMSVSLVTIHAALSEVPSLLTTDAVYTTARLTYDALKRIEGDEPRVAVLGLNPHSSDHGLFGDEEERIITPAVERLKEEGLRVEGPVPPDAAFTPLSRLRYDGFVAMYHDQGSIPFKMHHFEDGVNHTMGLPIVRTSVDHGTAFDIAWQGKAICASMLAAIDLAVRLSTP
jgi:4-hydroxythreonine-4-phosphate dehydrogenase